MDASPVSAAQPSRIGSLHHFVRAFLAYLGPRLPLVLCLVLAGAVLEGVGLLLLLPILSVAVGSAAGDEWLGGFTSRLLALVPDASPVGQLAFLLLLFAFVLAVRGAVILARDVTLAKVQVGFVESHRLNIIRLLANTRWDTVARLRHARITHVLGGDIQALGDAISMLLTSSVAAAMLAAQCVLILLLSPLLALLILALLILGAFALRRTVGRSRELGHGLTEANLHLMGATTQFLGGLKLALSQNLEAGFVRGFEQGSAEAASRRVRFARQRTSTQLWTTTAAAAVAGAVILLGVGVAEAAPSTLIAFLFVLARMNGPALQLQNGFQNIFHSLPAFSKVVQLEAELAAAQQSAPAHRAGAGSAPEGSIEFRNVSFWHREQGAEPGTGGLFGATITLREGSFVGLVGPSGAGKTTMADLLVGLYLPKEGEIRIGGSKLDDERLRLWRERVSYVSQDPFLFHDTIRQNLLWARPDAGDETLWQVLGRVGADSIVRRMEHQLDTVVGERGGLLSGGERQRIALARALLRQPRLLVLDEATNAIDIEGERAILQELSGSSPRPTIVMIAHRQSSLDLCETLIELSNGRIVTAGSARL